MDLDSGEDKKALCQLLGKLYIPDTVDDDKIRTLKLLMHNLRAVCIPHHLVLCLNVKLFPPSIAPPSERHFLKECIPEVRDCNFQEIRETVGRLQ